MSRSLVGLNVVLLAASALLGVYIYRESTRPLRDPAAVRPRAPSAPAAPAPEPAPARAPATASEYTIVAGRNLFSPTRSEAPPTPSPSAAAQIIRPPQPKPNLFGVVLGDRAPIAYLEDPTTRRVAGYRQGDAIAGGTVREILADRVVLARPEGNVDIRLHDPARPRPSVPPQAGMPGQFAPGQAVPPRPGIPQTAGSVPQVDPNVQPPGPLPAARRPIPPNLLRRLPPGQGGDAPSQ
jgi:hypothetical protein